MLNLPRRTGSAAPSTVTHCKVHILDLPGGYIVEHWSVDLQVGRETYDFLKDEEGDLYVTRARRNGREAVTIADKAVWTTMRQLMAGEYGR